tara:strand:- start:3866 stop:5443 length:1578 start_codon:yes stop_codon:yes gene_type:complete
MGCPTIKKAFEDSLNKSSLNTSDEFLTYDNGTIYNVTFGDIVTQSGLTGSLTSLNDGGATPILTGTAPGYLIRGIVGGNGIQSSVNAQGSITLNSQVANSGNANSGEALIPNTSADTINFRRLFAGNGITLTTESDRIIIDNSEVSLASNTRIISSLSDFPTPVSGVITLQDNINYFLTADISTSNRFVFGTNTVVSAADSFNTTLTYTGTGDMFTFSNGLAGVKEIGINCANGTFLNTAAVATGNLLLRWILLYQVKNLGSLNSPATGIYNVFIQSHTGQGFTVGAVANRRLNIDSFTVQSTTNATSIFADLGTATFTSLNIANVNIASSVAGQKFLKGAASGANLVAGVIGFISHNTITGGMIGLDTVTVNDAGWDFQNNNKISDTRPVALTYLSSSAATAISTVNTPVVVNGSFTAVEASLFTTNVNGRITYNGVRQHNSDITASITFKSASGTHDFTFYTAKNGVVISGSGVTQEVTATTTANVSLIWDLPLNTNDYVEIWVENNDNSNNVTIDNIVYRIK